MDECSLNFCKTFVSSFRDDDDDDDDEKNYDDNDKDDGAL